MIIGLTGSLASGKTTVSGFLRDLGAYVIDADKIARGLIKKPLRKKLAGFVFDDNKALNKLCRAAHPIVKERITAIIRKVNKKRPIIIDAPLLIESRLHRKCDCVIVVKCPYKKQLERAVKRLSIPLSQAKKRIAAQMPQAEKIRMADFVVDNGGSLRDTRRQVISIWRRLKSRPYGR